MKRIIIILSAISSILILTGIIVAISENDLLSSIILISGTSVLLFATIIAIVFEVYSKSEKSKDEIILVKKIINDLKVKRHDLN